MEIRFGLSEMSVISQVSAVEGCLLIISGVPLYYIENQQIKMLERLNQAIKQASQDESSDQVPSSLSGHFVTTTP